MTAFLFRQLEISDLTRVVFQLLTGKTHSCLELMRWVTSFDDYLIFKITVPNFLFDINAVCLKRSTTRLVLTGCLKYLILIRLFQIVFRAFSTYIVRFREYC